MAQLVVQREAEGTRKPSYLDDYFDTIQSRKKLPRRIQETLTSAFASIPVSSFPAVPGGQVVEVPGDASVADALRILSECKILSAPVTNPEEGGTSKDWRNRYVGIVDYSSIILWTLENAEIAAMALLAGSATMAGVGAGAVGALGAVALGVTGPVAVAGLTLAAVGAAMAGGMAAEKGPGKDATMAADKLGPDFYKVILQEEPFKSTKVRSIIKSYRWAPFIPVSEESSMLSVLLLLSKYRLRNVPVIQHGKPKIQNFITQSAVVQGLDSCRGKDWFDYIASTRLGDTGLPFMSSDKVVSIQSDGLILEAFKRMRDNRIGGLPVVTGQGKKIIGNVSIRDIRHLLLEPELFTNFRHLTVMDFMNVVHSKGGATLKMMPPITCKPDTTLGDVIHTLASRSVHRIYVVSGDDEVLGVITLRDVISCFVFEPSDYIDDYLGFSVKEMLEK
ncbi:hypothetical protein MLD38_037920 [Melastoma candidum]|uniref:Uncharacterized protein n=1 Tax=Melastoma candidum TaxID=119954 RepID=A0ACB9KYR1_9MYRT|nr:hypothetical protein MLD38_037920 [Melastoma candidum]